MDDKEKTEKKKKARDGGRERGRDVGDPMRSWALGDCICTLVMPAKCANFCEAQSHVASTALLG